MAIEGAGHAREEGGQNKDHQLIVGDVHAVGLGRDAVVADGHNGPAVAGVLQVHHDDDDQEHQDNAVGQQGLGVAVDGGGVEALGAAGDVQVGDDGFDDLTAAQGDDGQIVALEPQGGQADDQAHHRGAEAADDHGEGHPHRQGQQNVHCGQ